MIEWGLWILIIAAAMLAAARLQRRPGPRARARLHTLHISMPGAIMPFERHERYEIPLARALGALGEVDGGGTALARSEGGRAPAASEIFIRVADVAATLPIVRAVLQAQGAPAGTVIMTESETLPL